MEEGIFNHGIYWHSMSTSLFQGGAIAMAYAIIARLLAPREWRYGGLDVRLAHGTMIALLAIWNLVFALLSGITGFFTTWGFDAVSSVSLTMNKAMIGSFGLLAIILMIWIRARYDPDLWEDRSLRATYVVLGLMDSATAIVTGSLGGEAALLGTALLWFWELVRIEPRMPMIMPVWGSVALIVAALGLIAGAVAFRLRSQSA